MSLRALLKFRLKTGGPERDWERLAKCLHTQASPTDGGEVTLNLKKKKKLKMVGAPRHAKERLLVGGRAEGARSPQQWKKKDHGLCLLSTLGPARGPELCS